MKKLNVLLITLGLASTAFVAQATDLVDVLTQAQQSDPTYQQAKANYLATEATIGQARAALLPNLGLTGTWGNTYTKQTTDADFAGTPLLPPTTGSTTTSNNITGTGVTLNLTQNLFNWQAFQAYAQIKLNVKQAAAQYAAATQNLIMRTAQAYFAVLQQEDVLRYTLAQKTALKRQLEVAQQRYKVGLDPITSVYDAQAQYDSMSATYIATENELSNKGEELRQITGQLYSNLNTLKEDFPLVSPQPTNIDQWTQKSENQNLDLLAARYGMQAASENIKVQNAQHLPTLALTGSLSRTNQQNMDTTGAQLTDTSAYGLTLSVPLFAGGGVTAQVKQAQYQYQAAAAAMEAAHRQAVANTRKAYLGVVANISQIEADRQAIKSARAALASNQAGYQVGTQTILNVLTAQSTLYQAETTYAQDRFNYIINTLTLKSATGSLNANDIAQLNHWLVSPDALLAQKTAEAKVAPVVKPKKAIKKSVAKKPAKKTTHKKVEKKKVKPAATKPVSA